MFIDCKQVTKSYKKSMKPRKGHTLLCAIGVGTSRETLRWWAPCSPHKRWGMCESVYGYPSSKIFFGTLWI